MQSVPEGIHHLTAITAHAQANVDFYVRTMGLRMVKKTVNFDAPDVYHLYYGDESGRPGSILTFFEFPEASPGRHGTGMIHTVQWAVSAGALDYWENRLADAAVDSARSDGSLRLLDPEGMGIELVETGGAAQLRAHAPDIPSEYALRGFAGVRAYAADPDRSNTALTRTLGFHSEGAGRYSLTGTYGNPMTYVYDESPGRGHQGAGTVHHIAWAVAADDQSDWRNRIAESELRPTPIIDRQYFRSVYFREPSGVLFELATIGPGFGIDEPMDRLGETLCLPPQYEAMRARLEDRLTPIVNPRSQVS